jgi:acyl-coenzyme A synthetase/AMP-(fatty) acid ligase
MTAADADSEALLRAWNDTVKRECDRIAIVEAETGARCTFRELDARAAEWAAQHLGARRQWQGRSVLFALPNSIRWFEVFLGLVRVGAVVLPLDASEPEAAQREHVRALRATAWWAGDRVVAFDNARRFRSPIALIKLASGSTGQPRPLAFTGAQVIADGRQVTQTMGIRRTDLNYALIPFGHSYGIGNLTIPLVACGVPLVCGSAPLPHAVAADFTRWRPTVFPSVPAFWRALVTAEVSSDAFRTLRLAISAGAPLTTDVARSFADRFGQRLHNFYGSSETGGIAYDRRGHATLAGSVGCAMHGVRLRTNGGRLVVVSSAVFTHGNRHRNRDLGCWTPPDRVAMNARGELTLLGRHGKVIKIAGRRVNLGEVQARLRRVRGVEDAWIGASEGAEPVLGAVAVSARPAAELRAELQSQLPSWKVPKKWAVVSTWPLTDRGKVDTRALRALVFR